MQKFWIVSLGFIASSTAVAENWLENTHHQIQYSLKDWSHKLDSQIGKTDPNSPASARLRITIDNEWNRYDGYSIKPRIRTKIKLPALKQYLKNLSLVFGDEDLDNQSRDKNQLHHNYNEPLQNDKKYSSKQTRDDNASLAIRWSNSIKQLGLNTDFDVGIRSGADLFFRIKVDKDWQITEQLSTHFEQIYRYGLHSKYYLRTNFEQRFDENEKRSLNNHIYLQYVNRHNEEIFWGNSFYRQHNFSNFKRLNYGFNFGGDIEQKKPHINFYGPFINWRQSLFYSWFFIQPELNFYNNKKQNQRHHLGLFLRFETLF